MENEKKTFPCSKCGKVYMSFSGRYKHEKKCIEENKVSQKEEVKDEVIEPPERPPTPIVQHEHEQIQINGSEFRKWNPRVIIDRYNLDKPEPWIGLWYGMKESGKTTSIISILQKIRSQIDKIYIFSVSKENKERYQHELGGIPDQNLYNGFDDPNTSLFIEKLIKFQELTKGAMKVLLILDDIIDGKNQLHQSKILGSLFANHRRYQISVVLATQIPTGIAPITRQNANYVFVHYSKNESVKDMIYRDYLSSISKPEFCDLFENATVDHNILVIEPLLHDDYISVFNSRWE